MSLDAIFAWISKGALAFPALFAAIQSVDGSDASVVLLALGAVTLLLLPSWIRLVIGFFSKELQAEDWTLQVVGNDDRTIRVTRSRASELGVEQGDKVVVERIEASRVASSILATLSYRKNTKGFSSSHMEITSHVFNRLGIESGDEDLQNCRLRIRKRSAYNPARFIDETINHPDADQRLNYRLFLAGLAFTAIQMALG